MTNNVMRYKTMARLPKLARLLEFDPVVVMNHAGLPLSLLENEGRGLTAQQIFGFWNTLAEVLPPEKLGVELGRMMAHGPFIPEIFAFSCSPDVVTGLRRLALFKPLIGPFKLTVTEDERGVTTTVTSSEANNPLPTVMNAIDIGYLLEIIRVCSGSQIVPKRVTVPGVLGRIEDIEDYTRCAVEIGPTISLTLSHHDAQRPLMSENADQWEFFEAGLQRKLEAQVAQSSYADQVHATLLEMLPSGFSTIEAACERLRLTKRSLQRHLKNEGTSFNSILTNTRQNLARHYLQQPELRIEEISHLLAFRDPNSFYRAFQSWTGTTPQTARRTLG